MTNNGTQIWAVKLGDGRETISAILGQNTWHMKTNVFYYMTATNIGTGAKVLDYHLWWSEY